MMFFLNHGYRVIAHDRRGHGRSSQPGEGHDMDHYADDQAALTAHLDLKDAIHTSAIRPAAAKSCIPSRVTAKVTHLDSATGTFRLEQCELPFVKKGPLAA
jgi:alpha-beta hydrolase superfamily lysophospholipase